MIDESLAAHLHALFGDGDDWAVVGGHAANLYRRDARATVDTDVLVSLDRRTMQEVREILAHEGWAVRSMPEGGWLLRVAHPRYGSLDVIASETDYQQAALARAKVTMFGNISLRALAVEDVLIHKLIADRYKDDADVDDILRTNPALGRNLSEQVARRVGREGPLRTHRETKPPVLNACTPVPRWPEKQCTDTEQSACDSCRFRYGF